MISLALNSILSKRKDGGDGGGGGTD